MVLRRSLLVLSLSLLPCATAPRLLAAEVVGTSQPAPSLTRERIDRVLPPGKRQPWIDYLERSAKQRAADRAELAAERKGLAQIPPVPQESGSAHSIPLDHEAAWYATPEARHIADVIVSFQTPAGGWSKNMNMAGEPRQRGQAFTPNNISRYLGPNDFDAPADPDWNYVGTLDNDATTTELRFLGKVANALPEKESAPYRRAFVKGIEYLLKAQYPNGGWPQVWPLEGGYHDAITFNDNAVTEAAAVLTQLAGHRYPWACEQDRVLCEHAAESVTRAVHLIVAAQIKVDGKLTAWAQQQDPLTLEPVSGRNFEPAALSTGESADLLLYLMSLPDPSPGVRRAVDAGVAWLESTAIYGYTWSGGRSTPGGRALRASAGAGPIWPRYISLTTGKPIFGDRDKTIHDNVAELSLERRNGYAWYSGGPQAAIDAHSTWAARYAR